MMSSPTPEYISARRVLLDALEALDAHRKSVILVGAQAVYEHTGAANLIEVPTTTDADLALDVTRLANDPEIASTLLNAGFAPGKNPGSWIGAGDVVIDLMVVPAQANVNRPDARAARIPPHGKQTARIARGLEPALVDNAPLTVTALESSDSRNMEIAVAGPAALLVAKLVKISERAKQVDRQPDRLKAKDALDAFRILQAVEIDVLVAGFSMHRGSADASAVSREALAFLAENGSRPNDLLPSQAQSAALNDPTVAPSFVVLTNDLLTAIAERGLDA